MAVREDAGLPVKVTPMVLVEPRNGLWVRCGSGHAPLNAPAGVRCDEEALYRLTWPNCGPPRLCCETHMLGLLREHLLD